MASHQSTAGQPRVSVPAGRPAAALVVDDDPVMRRAIVRTLRARGMSVTEAGSADEALGHLRDHAADLLVTDLVMPGMLGSDLASQAVGLCPGLRLLMISGHSVGAPAPAGLDPADIAFLAKPFSGSELSAAIDGLRPLVNREPPPARHPAPAAIHPEGAADPPSRIAATLARVRSALPSGRTLPQEAWERRNRWLLWLLWLQIPPLAGLALAMGEGPSLLHPAAEAAGPTAFAVLATLGTTRRMRATAVALGLLTCAAVLVHVTGGLIEAHFHFFVVIGLLTLYEDWMLFLVAVSFVLLHHGLLGATAPHQVFAHGGNPWLWAGIHAAFVAAAGAVNVVAWRLNEEVRADHRRTAKALSRQALHDPLTGVPNRRMLDIRLREVLRDAHAAPAVFCVDIDGFKLVNDTHGHQAGDTLLIGIARRLAAQIRSADTLARLGGDEFVVVCPEVGDESEAMCIAARLSQAVLEPFTVEGEEMTLTLSIGFSLGDEDVGDPWDLVQRADLALYRAKQRGRSRFEFGSAEVVAGERTRIVIRQRLEEALAQDELSLRFQPIVDIACGTVVAFEALVRWEDPERGTLSPADFLPVAESSGLIVPMGHRMLAKACREAARWNREPREEGPVGLFVNASVRELAEPGYADAVNDAVLAAGIPHEQLTIEMTESAAMETDTALAASASLTALGVRVALDDFGTGYSSLDRLASLPASCVKADRRFVSSEDAAPEVLRAMGHLAREIGLWPVAEGVETDEQLRRVHAAGFAAAQGHLFARPLLPERARALLRRTRPFARHSPDPSQVSFVAPRAIPSVPRRYGACPCPPSAGA